MKRRAHLIASECIRRRPLLHRPGFGLWKEREVFGRPIGANQGISSRSPGPMRDHGRRPDGRHAAGLFDSGQPCGTEPTWLKMTASEASWFAADMCLQTHGGFGFARNNDIERKFRETRLSTKSPDLHQFSFSACGHPRAGHAQVVLGLAC